MAEDHGTGSRLRCALRHGGNAMVTDVSICIYIYILYVYIYIYLDSDKNRMDT